MKGAPRLGLCSLLMLPIIPLVFFVFPTSFNPSPSEDNNDSLSPGIGMVSLSTVSKRERDHPQLVFDSMVPKAWDDAVPLPSIVYTLLFLTLGFIAIGIISHRPIRAPPIISLFLFNQNNKYQHE